MAIYEKEITNFDIEQEYQYIAKLIEKFDNSKFTDNIYKSFVKVLVKLQENLNDAKTNLVTIYDFMKETANINTAVSFNEIMEQCKTFSTGDYLLMMMFERFIKYYSLTIYKNLDSKIKKEIDNIDYNFIDVIISYVALPKTLISKLEQGEMTLTEVLTNNERIFKTTLPNRLLLSHDKYTKDVFENKDFLVSCSERKKINKRYDNKLPVIPVKYKYIDYDNLQDVQVRPLGDYDKQVYDAICTLEQEKMSGFTLLTLYRTMLQNPNAQLHEKNKNKLIECIDRLMQTKITVRTKNGEIETYLLKCTVLTNRVVNSQVSSKYYFFDSNAITGTTPILFAYASSINQVKTLNPMQIISQNPNRKRTSRNGNLETIKKYLINEIGIMKLNTKNQIKRHPIILYSSVYDIVGLDQNTKADTLRKQKSRVREQVKEALDDLIKIEEIKGYNEKKESQTATKIEIFL